MTISTTDDPRAGPYNGNDSQTAFPFSFKVFEEEDLRAVHTDADGIDTDLTLDSDFSVSLNADQNSSPGGTVTYPMSGDPLPDGETLTITSDLDYTQETDIQNAGGFYPEVIENALDRVTMLIKQVHTKVVRTLQLSVTTPDGVDASLPAPVAASVVGWNAAGTALRNYLLSDGITVVGVNPDDLASTASATKGAGMSGVGVQDYPDDTVGSALFTTLWGNGATDKSTALAAANALGLPIRIIGALHIGSATTITVPIVDTMAQIFTTTSAVTIDNGLPVRPEWFGSTAGSIARAVNSLPFAKGGTVRLANATYPPSYSTATGAMFEDRSGTPGVDYMVRKHIRIEGDRLPSFNAGETALENGTIIQGPFYVGAECDGFQIDNVGVDSGSDVCTALYAGVEQDGFCIVQTNKTVPVIGTQFAIGSVVGLCKTGSTGAHAVLVEGVSGGEIGRLEGRQGYHGVAIKSRHMHINALVGHGCGGEDVIIKGDTYAVCSELQIDSITAGGLTGVETGVGVQIQAGTESMGSIQIGSIFTLRKDWGLVVVAGSKIIADVQVGRVLSQSCTAGGYQLSGDCRRVRIGDAELNASPYAVYVTGATDRSNHIASLAVANCTNGVYCDGKISIGDAHFDTVTTALVYGNTSANITLSRHTSVALTSFWSVGATLAGTWVSHAGGDAFNATLENGRVVLSGLLQSGAAATLISALAANIRPTQNYRFNCLGFDGAAYAPVEVTVGTTGAVSMSPLAAASSYLSLSGVQWPVPF